MWLFIRQARSVPTYNHDDSMGIHKTSKKCATLPNNHTTNVVIIANKIARVMVRWLEVRKCVGGSANSLHACARFEIESEPLCQELLSTSHQIKFIDTFKVSYNQACAILLYAHNFFNMKGVSSYANNLFSSVEWQSIRRDL